MRRFRSHGFAADSPPIARHLAFRDYLRAHPDEAKAWEAEKIRAAARHPDNTLLYNDARSHRIERTERDALASWKPGG